MNPTQRWIQRALVVLASLPLISQARQLMPLGNALMATLKSKSATPSSKPDLKDKVYYTIGADKKPERVSVVEKGLWGTNCTHTWVIGLDAKTAKVDDIKITELSCPHADPINTPKFLSQFKGKGPADSAKLKLGGGIDAAAKATGSSEMTIDAVKKAIKIVADAKGSF